MKISTEEVALSDRSVRCVVIPAEQLPDITSNSALAILNELVKNSTAIKRLRVNRKKGVYDCTVI